MRFGDIKFRDDYFKTRVCAIIDSVAIKVDIPRVEEYITI